jgi:hypothetical protein
MKALLVLFSATAAFASRTTHTPYYYTENTTFPVTSLVFTIIFGIVMSLNILWIVKVAKAKQNLNPSDVEKQSLVNSTLPEGVVSTNITVSAKSRPRLLAEVRHDEHLVWANENIAPLRRPILILLSMALLFTATGFASAFSFLLISVDDVDSAFLAMWLPLIGMDMMFYMLAGMLHKASSNSVIYALTSKRVFILSSMGGGCCCGRTETVRAYDLDGIHQTTLTRKDDGSGTLTFSAAAVADGVTYNGHHQHHGLFAFSDIPNVTAVKDLIEQYKTLRKKQAGNQ